MAWKLAIKENPLPTMVKNTDFVVPVADGHLKRIQNNLLKMTKVEILTTPGCTNCSVVEKMLDEMESLKNYIPIILISLIVIPILFYFARKKLEVSA